MQNKIFGGLIGIILSGVSFQAGRVYQRDKNVDFSSNKVQIEHPKPQGVLLNSVRSTPKQTQSENLIESLVQPPFRIIKYPHFEILYSTVFISVSKYHKCPLAVYERVTKSLAIGDAPRRSTFFKQPSLQEQFQSTNDHFVKSGAFKNLEFSRGHMAAAGNYSGNKEAKFMTFTYANVVPQNQHNNAGIWNTFERYARDLVVNQKCDSVQLISGPIYFKNHQYQTVDGQKYQNVFKQESLVLMKNGVVAPQKLYKIIKCNTKNGHQFLDAFQFWNKKTFQNQKPLKEFRTSLESVENQTGLKFKFKEDEKGEPLKSLVEFDAEGFSKTKNTYDQNFYLGMIRKSKSIQEMSNFMLRAKDQQILISHEQFKEQTSNLFDQDLAAMSMNYSKNPQKTACQTLNKLIKLNNSLNYLHQMTKDFQDQIQNAQNAGPFQLCLQKANRLRSTDWEDYNNQQNQQFSQKQEKISLNSLTSTIVKSLKKKQVKNKKTKISQEKVEYTKFQLVNQEKLKLFVPLDSPNLLSLTHPEIKTENSSIVTSEEVDVK